MHMDRKCEGGCGKVKTVHIAVDGIKRCSDCQKAEMARRLAHGGPAYVARRSGA